jgi:hypothetical protein
MRFHCHKAFQCAGLLLLASPDAVQSLQRDDAGVLDFVVATAGHGVTRHVSAVQQQDAILTSDAVSLSSSSSTSCYVASRKMDSGRLVWRRNVCSTPSTNNKKSQHALAVSTSQFYTMDSAGVARAWTNEEGSLVWDAQVPNGSAPGVWSVSVADTEYVAAASEGDLTILKADTGAALDSISAIKALSQKLKSGETAQWLSVVASPEDGSNALQGVVAFVQADGTTSGNRMWAVTMQIGNDEFTSNKSMGNIKATIIASSFQAQLVGGSWSGLALTKGGGSAVTCSLDGKDSDEITAEAWKSSWTGVTAIRPTANPSMITVQGVDSDGAETMGLFRVGDKGWEELKGSEASQFGGVAFCPEAKLVIALGSDSLKAYQSDSMSPLSVSGDMFVPDGDFVEDISVVQCTADSVTTLLSTAGGTTTQINFSLQGNSVTVKMGWTAEEGLASVSSAVVLDASHLGSDDLVEEQDAVANKLSLSSRLSSQVDAFSSLFSFKEGEFSRRDHVFGFVKIAALLSQTSHRIWGVNTSGDDRGSVRWSLDLPKTASWHTMVHGTTNSPNALHGINGGTHSREILVVSPSADSVEWKCIDGTNGVIHAQESTSVSSPVSQVIPVYGSAGGCRQAALLLHEDRTLTVIPGDEDTVASVKEHLALAPNGMYTHFVDKISSRLESFQVYARDTESFATRQVGRTSFAGEKIVKVTYPIRDQMIQTMSHILGDNSLLLKYVNPHLAVIITVADEGVSSKTNLAASIEKSQGEGPKRKPAGVGDAAAVAESKPEDAVSNLFVNLVDTVSGRVLHRASHANADVTMDVTALISENWVIYSFANAKTRRTEIGVLTLHEGMIDPKGIGLFTSPEQTTSFSSFDARETKPVVLSKTYTYPKFITALGVTATRGGISTRNILIASDDGKITSIKQVMLETRRPMGEVKDAEKKEGLFPYNELILQVPFSVVSYNHTVDSVTSVVSAPTALESQSLVLAFGGPDLFFTRTSPSRGFDLLPDNYSRILVSFVTAGLVVVLFIVRRMGSQKALKQGWL